MGRHKGQSRRRHYRQDLETLRHGRQCSDISIRIAHIGYSADTETDIKISEGTFVTPEGPVSPMLILLEEIARTLKKMEKNS